MLDGAKALGLPAEYIKTLERETVDQMGGVPPEKPGSGLFQQKQLQNSPVSIIIYVKNRPLNGVITIKKHEQPNKPNFVQLH